MVGVSVVAYIGPGAGFAVMGSFLILIAAALLGVFSLLTLPLRLLVGLWRRPPAGEFRRVVIVGFDGMDPRRAARLIGGGRLPNLAKLAEEGTFAPLGSTCPPMSPVAWSTFATGVNPGKHGIYDFLNRNLRDLAPELSSARIAADAKGRAHAVGLRRSVPFWKLLGDAGVFSTILRVPITFPAERFNGVLLSAMCAPDIRGTQGEFTIFDDAAEPPDDMTGGMRVVVEVAKEGGRRRVRAELAGPNLGGAVLTLPLEVEWRAGEGRARLVVGRERVELRLGETSAWVRLKFKRNWHSTAVHAIARFNLVALEPEFRLYVSPLNISPERPALPISWPEAYSGYLAKRHGLFSTLGLAEDTWALTSGAIDETAFLGQVYDIHAEREAMFFNALRLTRRGVCMCVFDITDRVQHTFLRRGSEQDGPLAEGALRELMVKGTAGVREGGSDAAMVDGAYEACDAVVGRLLPKLGKRDLLLVLSDHGFTTFTRCINVNAWLRDNGYLVEREPGGAGDMLSNIEWSQTRAYSFGLTGIYLNMAGRESQGIVAAGEEARQLAAEIVAKLEGLHDEGRPVVKRLYQATEVYSGPYMKMAPDIICGWHSGFRHSWETAVGRTDGPVFADNPSHWCADHCVDRGEVPGVLFSNYKMDLPVRGAHLLDITPTLLSLWGLDLPKYLDGEAWRVVRPGARP